MLEIEKKLIIELIEFSEQLNINNSVKFTDLAFNIYTNKIKILLSILIKENLIRDENNDEIVMECELIRDIGKINIDITDSLGVYFYKNSLDIENPQLINLMKENFLNSIKNM